MSTYDDLATNWLRYLSTHDWRTLCTDVPPREDKCGRVYELGHVRTHPDESVTIVDMRSIEAGEPHYHSGDQTETYVVIQGTGTVVIGNELHEVGPQDVLTTPPMTAHYVIPHDQLVVGMVTHPAFDRECRVGLTESNALVHFDADMYDDLAKHQVDDSLQKILQDLSGQLDAWASVFHVPNEKGTVLASRARYNIPDDWAAMSYPISMQGWNARAFSYELEIVDNGIDEVQPPGKPAETQHHMTASAIVPVSGLGTLHVIADADGYVFTEQKLHLMRNIAGAAAMLVELGEAP